MASVLPESFLPRYQTCLFKIPYCPLYGACGEFQFAGDRLHPRPASALTVAPVAKVNIDGLCPMGEFLLSVDKIKCTHNTTSFLEVIGCVVLFFRLYDNLDRFILRLLGAASCSSRFRLLLIGFRLLW